MNIFGSEHHWIKKRFFDAEPNEDILAITTNYMCNEWLDEADEKMFEDMKKNNYKRYLVAGLGEWGIAEGLVFYNFDPEKHVIDKIPEGYGEYYLSIDYGTINPFACLLWKIQNNVAYCIAEYYYDSKEEGDPRTDEEHYYHVEKLAEGYFIDSIIIDPSAASFKTTIMRHGKFDITNANNDVLNGINNFISLLDSDFIKISYKCENLIREFKKYRWSEDGNEVVIKEFDHCLDSSRYFINTILTTEFDHLDWGKQR